MLDALRQSAGSWVAKALMGLLVVSFGVWGIADIFRGYSSDVVATVGGEEITLAEYEREIAIETNDFSKRLGQPLSRQQAHQFGIDSHALSQLIGLASLDAGTNKMGLAVGDEALRRSIASDPQLIDAFGKFDRQTLLSILQRAGVTEQQFISDRRKYLIRKQVNDMMQVGVDAPSTLLNSISTYQNETRTAAYLVLPPAAVGTVADPDDKTVQAYYQRAAIHFTRPETRDFSVMVLEPKNLAPSITVSEDDLKKAYEEHRDEYDVPEKRAVIQIPFSTKKLAEAAVARLRKGKTVKKIISEIGLEDKDVNLGIVTRAQMISPTVADAAFALKLNAYSDPVEGPLGPVILHVTKIDPAKPSTFEGVKDKVKTELVADKARSQVYDVQNGIEDARAGGATLEDIAAKNGLKVVKYNGVTKEGETADRKPFPGLPSYKDLLDTVYKSEPGDQIPPGDTGDGGYYWVRVDTVTPPQLKPLKDVRADVVALWKTEKRKADLDTLAQKLVADGNKGESFDKIASGLGRSVVTLPGIKRDSQSDTLSRVAVTRLFAAPKGGFTYGQAGFGDSLVVMQVKDIVDPTPDPKSADYKKLHDDMVTSMQNDMLQTFIKGLQKQFGAKIDATLVERVANAGDNTQ